MIFVESEIDYELTVIKVSKQLKLTGKCSLDYERDYEAKGEAASHSHGAVKAFDLANHFFEVALFNQIR